MERKTEEDVVLDMAMRTWKWVFEVLWENFIHFSLRVFESLSSACKSAVPELWSHLKIFIHSNHMLW